MGVDISHIIRHNFREVSNHEAAAAYVRETIQKLKKGLFLYGVDEYFDMHEDGGMFVFRLPVYDVEFELHDGFWVIESFYHYCQLVMHKDNYFWIRCLTYDIARILGQDEAWYAEEFYTWNGGGTDNSDIQFSHWLEDACRKYGHDIPEFPLKSFLESGADDNIPKYEPIYHDSFKECHLEYNDIQSRLNDMRLIGLYHSTFNNNVLRCEKDGFLYLVDPESLQSVIDYPIEYLLDPICGFEFAVKKGDKHAVFQSNGAQRTDFVDGEFKWKWIDYLEHRVIYNEEAGIEIHT